jgi:hypothetical protein
MSQQEEHRYKIYKALEVLVQQKKLSDVKVVDLCRVSGIPRSTFYTLFYDIYSVPQYLWDNLMQPTLYQIGATKTWNEGHRLMFQNLLNNKAIFLRIYWESDYHSIPEYGYRGAYVAIKRNVEQRKNYQWTNDELVELDYTIKALATLTTKWGRDGMVVPVERIVYIFDQHLPKFLKDLCNT